MTTQTQLYDDVVKVTKDYLGPAAERFITRQIHTHLNKTPDALTKADLVKLADWIKVAIALLTEDSDMVNDFTKSILQLAEDKAPAVSKPH